MVALAEIAAGFEALKAAAGLVQALNASATQATINEVKLELQQRLLDAQRALLAAQEAEATTTARMRDLEQQIVKFEDWEREKQRYELKAIAPGAFAYVPKAGMENGDPPHWLCANCFENRRKSIYQKLPGSSAQTALRIPTSYECGTCKSKVSLQF